MKVRKKYKELKEQMVLMITLRNIANEEWTRRTN